MALIQTPTEMSRRAAGSGGEQGDREVVHWVRGDGSKSLCMLEEFHKMVNVGKR